jgi:hypothetical protein
MKTSGELSEMIQEETIVVSAKKHACRLFERWMTCTGALQFCPNLCAFNISWHERSQKEIYSFITPHKGAMQDLAEKSPGDWYADFPVLRPA